MLNITCTRGLENPLRVQVPPTGLAGQALRGKEKSSKTSLRNQRFGRAYETKDLGLISPKRLDVLVGLQRPLLVRQSKKSSGQFGVQFMQTFSPRSGWDVEGLGVKLRIHEA